MALSPRRIICGFAIAGVVLATGMATSATAQAATSGSPCSEYSTSEPELSYNPYSSSAVKEMQCEVNRADPRITSINIDGYFGQQTQNAVIDFQRCVGLYPDGVVGPNTWAQLDNWSSSTSWPTCQG